MSKVRKPESRKKARRLRREGESLKVIARSCGVSPSTAKRWTDDITLTAQQRQCLEDRAQEVRVRNGQGLAMKGQSQRRLQYEARVEQDRVEADKLWPSLKGDADFMFGLALYIGEGDKTTTRVGLTNADPRVLRHTLRFMGLLGCDMKKVRVHVVLHAGENPTDALRYWAAELNIPEDRFNKVTPSKVSGGVRATKLPFGTASVRVSSARIKRRLNRWMELALEGRA